MVATSFGGDMTEKHFAQPGQPVEALKACDAEVIELDQTIRNKQAEAEAKGALSDEQRKQIALNEIIAANPMACYAMACMNANFSGYTGEPLYESGSLQCYTPMISRDNIQPDRFVRRPFTPGGRQ